MAAAGSGDQFTRRCLVQPDRRATNEAPHVRHGHRCIESLRVHCCSMRCQLRTDRSDAVPDTVRRQPRQDQPSSHDIGNGRVRDPYLLSLDDESSCSSVYGNSHACAYGDGIDCDVDDFDSCAFAL